MAQSLADLIVQTHQTDTDEWWRVDATNWLASAQCVKEEGFRYLSFVSAIDWQPNPDLDGEHVFNRNKQAQGIGPVIVDEEVRYGGGSTRFQVIARVYNVSNNIGKTLITDVPDETLTISSWTSVYRGADWHERETWEMFGITFSGHPGLRHIYLPSEFEGFPLRKDFPLLARVVRPWPGLVDMEEMPKLPEVENQLGDE